MRSSQAGGEGFSHTIIAATKTALESYVGPWSIGKDPTAIGASCPMMRRVGVPFTPNLS